MYKSLSKAGGVVPPSPQPNILPSYLSLVSELTREGIHNTTLLLFSLTYLLTS